MATLTSISGLESAMGPAIEKSSKGIVSDIVKCIGDNKKHMRECTSWVASTDLDKMVQYITASITPMTNAKLGADGRTDLFDWLSKQLAIQLRPKIGMSNQLSKQLVMKNVSDIQGPTLAIVLERLKSHGVFPEVHDKTRVSRTGPTVKTTSKIVKSNWLSKQLAIHVYLQELGIDEIRRRVGARENDLHMLKTLLYELCKLRGTAITGHLSMVPIDMEPQPIILAYIDLNLQMLAASRMLTPTRPTGQTQWGDLMANNPMPAAHSVGPKLKFVSFLNFKRGVSAKGSKAESIMFVQDKSGPVGSRLAFTPTEPQRESHLMPQPSVIGPTDSNEATPTVSHCFRTFTVSRLHSYPDHITPIAREIQAPCTTEVPSASIEIPSGNGMEIDNSHLTFGIHPFNIEKRIRVFAPTTRRNSMRVLQAMQLKKPVLLEASLGVGKTSLVLALGKFSGHSGLRINFSEQVIVE
ncbi:protein MOR1 isoform X1 [Tanacetum coccineum]